MSKTTAKILSILFAFFSLSAIKETFTIMNSPNPGFGYMALILTAGFIWISVYFWKKSKRSSL